MVTLSKLSLSAFTAFFVSTAGAKLKPNTLPAKEILKAIQELESKDNADIPLIEYYDYVPQNTSQPVIEWDATASPLSTKSWLMFQLEDDTIDRLKQNIDQKGQPLL